jgi:hypothetical protein
MASSYDCNMGMARVEQIAAAAAASPFLAAQSSQPPSSVLGQPPPFTAPTGYGIMPGATPVRTPGLAATPYMASSLKSLTTQAPGER